MYELYPKAWVNETESMATPRVEQDTEAPKRRVRVSHDLTPDARRYAAVGDARD